MAAKFSLDGSMIPRQVKRLFDQRAEQRVEPSAGTAVLAYRGTNHVVRLVNLSDSGAMVAFPHIPHIGERLTIRLVDRGTLSAQVRWIKDGRIGLAFSTSRG
ncbi:MAG: PilZ domain-containing protein [Sphingomicrobium sp.]